MIGLMREKMSFLITDVWSALPGGMMLLVGLELLIEVYTSSGLHPYKAIVYASQKVIQQQFPVEVFMAQQNILVVGSLNMDQVVRVPRVPVLGETLLGSGSLKLVPGGKGANQAVAIVRLGGSVSMAGRVGADPFGQQLLQALQADRVDTSLIALDEQEASGVAFIFLTPDGDNSIIVAAGANMRVGHDSAQLTRITEAIQHAQALVLQLEIPLDTVKILITTAHAAHVPVFLNLAPAQPLPAETL